MSKARILVLAALVGCMALLGVSVAQAGETVKITAKFVPDKLNSPINVNGGGEFTNSTGKVPSPLTKIVIAGPAGMKLNLKGTGTCTEQVVLNTLGKGCPKNSIAGAGGGLGVFELAGEEIKEEFTLNIFRGPSEGGKVVLLIFVDAVSPVSVQLVLKADVVTLPAPYGLGIEFHVPLIPTLPEASNASVRNAHITIGATKVVYKVKGKKVHVKGIISPKKCPKGGWPVKSEFSFEDGSTALGTTTITCPKK